LHPVVFLRAAKIKEKGRKRRQRRKRGKRRREEGKEEEGIPELKKIKSQEFLH